MPFQLDTRVYGGGGGAGGGGRQRFGMLGAMMDIQARQQQLQGQEERNALINEQRQQAIDKNRQEKEQADALDALFGKNPNPSLNDISAIVGPTNGTKIWEATVAARDKNSGNKIQRIASIVGGVKAYPTGARAQAWDTAQQLLVRDGTLTEEEKMPYSPELLDELHARALNPLQQTQEETSRRNAITNEAAEKRLLAAQQATQPGQIADARVKVRAEAVQRLLASETVEDYTANYNDLAPDMRGGIPTPERWVRNRPRSLAELRDIGLTPEQAAMNRDRDLDRAQRAQQHKETETRLGAVGVVTDRDRKAAMKERANDEQALQRRVEDRAASNKPMTPAEILDARYQIAQNFDEAVHNPPSMEAAEGRKKAAFEQLEEKILRKKEAGYPMSDKDQEQNKLLIENKFRATFGYPPLTKLPESYTPKQTTTTTETTTPAPAPRAASGFNLPPPVTTAPTPRAASGFNLPSPVPGRGVLGGLVNPTPPAPPPAAAAPTAAPPGPPPAPPLPLGRGQKPPVQGSPAAQDPRAAAEARQLFDEIVKTSALITAGKQVDLLAQDARRKRYRQLTGT